MNCYILIPNHRLLNKGLPMKFKRISTLFICSLLFSSFLQAGNVSRSQFTSQVVDREPVDKLDNMSSDMRQMYYFTELKNLQGQNVIHQWEYNYKVMYEKSFTVGGPRWRVWSSKTIHPGWSGSWTVNTLSEDGANLHSESFEHR